MAEDSDVWIVKLICIFGFLIIAGISGIVPIMMKKFRSNQKLLAFSQAFSGGLFLGVGLLHLLPEANRMIDQSLKEDNKEAYPFSYLITIISFSVILFIEKVAAQNIHQHYYISEAGSKTTESLLDKNAQNSLDDKVHKPEYQSEQDKLLRDQLNSQRSMAQKISIHQNSVKVSEATQSNVNGKSNKWAPFILQIAVGIHAVFEGLSIGIQQEVSLCIAVAVAVACHKWAEGFTLGSAFRKAGVTKKIAIPMILVQSSLNPIGILIGWLLTESGDLITGIFLSISVGTFLYISTLEILVEEFNVSRLRFQKYCAYVAALVFVASFWFIEKLLQVE